MTSKRQGVEVSRVFIQYRKIEDCSFKALENSELYAINLKITTGDGNYNAKYKVVGEYDALLSQYRTIIRNLDSVLRNVDVLTGFYIVTKDDGEDTFSEIDTEL